MILELQRADRVRDVLQRVRHAVRPVIRRIDAPLISGAVVRRMPDAVHRRIAKIDIGRSHVDLRAQHVCAVRVRAAAHFAQQAQVLRGGTVAVRAVLADLGKRAAVSPHLFRALAVHVCESALDQVLRKTVEMFEIIRRVVKMPAPVEAEPSHRIEYGIDVLLLFFFRIRVVEAQVAEAAVVARQPEVETDRLGVPDVQVAVGFRGKARADFGRVGRGAGMRRSRTGFAAPGARGMLAGREVGFDDAANEIRRGRRLRRGFF